MKYKILSEQFEDTYFVQNFRDLKEAIEDILKNPNKYKDKKHLAPMLLTILPLFAIAYNKQSGGSKSSAFILGFSSVSTMFSDLLRTYRMTTTYNRTNDIISYNYSTIDLLMDFLTGASSALLVFGVALTLIISKIIISKFSKKRLLNSKNTFSFGVYYSAGSFVGMIIGLILFIYYIKQNDGKVYLKDVFVGYFKMIKDAFKNVFTANTNSRMGFMFSLSLIFDLIVLVIQLPIILKLIQSVFGKNKKPIEYKGNSLKLNKRELKIATSKISKIVGKDLEKEAMKLANKFKLTPDGISNMIAAYLSSKKFMRSIKDIILIKDTLTGKNKPDEILAFKKSDVSKIENKYLKEDNTGIAIAMSGSGADSITQISGLDQYEGFDKLLNMPSITIEDKKTFKLACYKAIVDLYKKLRENGYEVNDVKLVITKKFVPPFTLDNVVVLGYGKRFWNNFTSDHVAAVIAHEFGHVFNQDIKISVSDIIQYLLSGLASFSYYRFNLSLIPKAERILLGFTFNLVFLRTLEAGRTAEINADAFAIKLGYAKELYDFLNYITSKYGAKDYLSQLLEELDEHDRSDRRLKAIKDVVETMFDVKSDKVLIPV